MYDSLISIIIPAYNEERNVRLIAENLLEQLHEENLEILFVDDGSTDATLAVLRELSVHPSIRYVSFSRNFGHQNALKAGFDLAEGDCAITMDGDLQHPAELVPSMIAMWRSGADVVHTRRKKAASSSWFKRITTSWYYKIFSWCATVAIEPGTADFRLLDRKIVDLCKAANDDAFFWRGFVPWLGLRQEFIDYEPHPRAHGASKYNVKKMLHLAWTGIASFSMLPLRMAGVLGALGLLSSLLYFCYILWLNIYGMPVPGWSSLMVVLLFFSAIQLISLGVLGEYVGKIYMGAKRRPHYILRETNVRAPRENGRKERA
jgi:dolichol-phosphate mannosyltransferase